MSGLRLYFVRERKFWTSCDMMSVMSEIDDYVLDSPIALTSAYDTLIGRFLAALLARQQYHPQLVEVYQPQIVQVSEGESPKSPSDSAEEWDDAQTMHQGTHVRMWHTTPLSQWRLNLLRESDSLEFQ